MKIFGYLKSGTGRRKIIVISPEDIRYISDKGDNTSDWMEKYPGEKEDIYEVLTEPRGKPLSKKVYFYSDHSHDQVTQRSVYGFMCFFL